MFAGGFVSPVPCGAIIIVGVVVVIERCLCARRGVAQLSPSYSSLRASGLRKGIGVDVCGRGRTSLKVHVKSANCDSNFILLRIIKTYRIIKIKIRS